jgi:quinoprotein glucose dehydrogenase
MFLALLLLTPQGSAPADLPRADGFAVADGLSVELHAAEPLLQNPVALSVDGLGRVHVVETHRYLRSVFDVVTYQPEWLPDDLGLRTVADRRAFLLQKFAADPTVLTSDTEVLRRLVDVDGDGRADVSEVLLEGFDEPECGPIAGVLARNGEIHVACIPDLVRVKEGGDSERLATGFGVHVGVSGHDLHGLRLGPDGRLYFSVGDRGAHVVTAVGETIDLPDTGAVYRCELDGSSLEAFAIGLRNPQELAFDAAGNLFTADNDTAGADRSRVVHVVPGGDYGWRCSYQHMAGFGPWVQEELWRGGIGGALPHAGYVAQGPAGLTYAVDVGWSSRWRGCFFVCDFPGGVLAFRVEAVGASFRTVPAERVVWNLWPTDADFGPDGALYVSDWVAGWVQPLKGRIWRVRDSHADDTARAAALESAHILAQDLSTWGVPARIALLGHVDARVRTEAHLSLALAGSEAQLALQELALDSTADHTAHLHATFGLAIAQRLTGARNDATLTQLLAHPIATVRATAARALGELKVASAVPELVKGLADGDDRVAFECAAALARLGGRDPLRALGRPLAPFAAAPSEPVRRALSRFTVERTGDDPYLAHAAALALLAWYGDDELAAFANAAEPTLRNAALNALRRARSPRVSAFLRGTTLVEAARAIHDEAIAGAEDEL